MRYFEPAPGFRLSRVALGGHEYLADGRSRGFNESFADAVRPGHIFPGFGGPARRAVLARAYDLGITFFDVTLDSEKEALGRNLAEMPPPCEVFVQTRPEGMVYGYDPGNRKLLDLGLLRAEVQRCLKLLRRDRLDILNCAILKSALDGTPGYLDILAGNVAELRREGLIGIAAADTFSGAAVYRAMIATGAFATLNVNFNLADDGAADGVFDLPAGMVVREAFVKGDLFRLGAAAGIGDRTLLARAAMKWVTAHPGVDAVIAGAANPAHLSANVAAALAPAMSETEMAALAAIAASADFVALRTGRRRSFLEIAG